MVICNIDVNRMLISYYVLLGEGNKNIDVGCWINGMNWVNYPCLL